MKTNLVPFPTSRTVPVRVSPRDAEVLDRLHLLRKDIAADLGISENNVKARLKRLYIVLGVETRAQAVAVWQRRAA